MIAIDTNILVRYLVRDDPVQAELARQLLQERLTPEQPGLITVAVVVELAWVLGGAFRLPSGEIRSTIRRLLASEQLVFESSDVIEAALRLPHGDIADAIIHLAGKAAGSVGTLTFDRKFARLDGVELLS